MGHRHNTSLSRLILPTLISVFPLTGQTDCESAVAYGSVGDEAKTGTLSSGGEAWVSFISTGDLPLISIMTCGSGFDTELALYASCDASGPLTTNDDACGAQSIIDYANLSAGTFYVKITGKGDASGDYTLTIKVPEVPDPPTGLTATTAEDSIQLSWNRVTEARTYKVYQVVDDASGLTCEEQGLRADCDGNCFAWDIGSTYLGDGICDDGTYGVNFNCDLYDNDEGDCSGRNALTAAVTDEKISLILPHSAVMEKTYVYRGQVDTTMSVLTGFYPETSVAFVTTSQNGAGESDYSDELSVTTPPPYAGQTCDIAEEATIGENQALGKNQWFVFTASSDGELEVTSMKSDSSSTWDTNLKLYASCDAEEPVAANDDCCGVPGPSAVKLDMKADSTVYIFWENTYRPGKFSFWINFEAAVPVVKPTGLIATGEETAITLTWDSQQGADSYVVYMVNDTAGYDFVKEVFGGDTTATITDLDYETQYCFAVSAVGYNGESERSDQACAFTGDAPPAPHFTPVYTGAALDPMRIYVQAATYAGEPLHQDFEIGIYDDSLCVGYVMLDDTLTSSFVEIVTSADDLFTAEADGFTEGNSISFRLYSRTLDTEITDVTAEFAVNNSSTFQRNSSTNVSLSAAELGPRECGESVPQWTVNADDFTYAMNVVGAAFIVDTPVQDASSQVAAFVGEELRGSTTLDYVPAVDRYLAFLPVYSNSPSGETVRFQLFSNPNCKFYPVILETVEFSAGTVVGSAGDPQLLHAADYELKSTAFTPGTTWLSFNGKPLHPEINEVVGSLGFSGGDQMEGFSTFAQYHPDAGWVGTLKEVEVAALYSMSVSDSAHMVFAGSPVNYPTHEINFHGGWNWLGYLPDVAMDITTALADIDATESDMLVHQDGFANYISGVGWAGTVDSLHPGDGFMLYTEAAGSFVYGGGTSLARAQSDSSTIIRNDIGWVYDPAAYRYRMAFVGKLQLGGVFSADTLDQVGAFFEAECRGIGRMIHIPETEEVLAFLMIHSNVVSGETITLRTYDASSNAEEEVLGEIAFESDTQVGNVIDPLIIANALYDPDEIPTQYQLSNPYPNPFNPSASIDYELNKVSRVTVKIYNSAGKLVRTLVNQTEAPGYRSITWHGLDNDGRPVPTGVYLLVMEATPEVEGVSFDWFRESRKMLLMK